MYFDHKSSRKPAPNKKKKENKILEVKFGGRTGSGFVLRRMYFELRCGGDNRCEFLTFRCRTGVIHRANPNRTIGHSNQK